jgi:hypothetical protein
MGRPTDWYKLSLDSDPTPGDWSAIDQLGRSYTTFANKVNDVHTRLGNVEKCGTIAEWKGLSADEFRKQLGDLPGQLDKLFHSYQLAGKALSDFASAVDAAQRKADSALSQADPLWRELQQKQAALPGLQSGARTAQSASDKLNHPTGNVPPPDENQVRTATRNARNANQAATDCSNRISAIQSQLHDLRTQATNAGTDRSHAADDCVRQLKHASDVGIHNKHWWEKAWDFIADNWHFVISALKIIVAIGGIILLFVPGLNILAFIVLAAALVVLADTLVKAIQGKAGWGDVLLAALDCVPVLGKIGMIAKAGEALKGMSVIGKAASWTEKTWKFAEDYKGLNKVAAEGLRDFGKDMVLNNGADLLNGKSPQWGKNAFNAGVGFGGGFLKYGVSTHLDDMAYRTRVFNVGTPGHPENIDMLDFYGKGTALNNLVSGGIKGFTTSVVKEAGNDWLFGGGTFDAGKVTTGTLSGMGSSAMSNKYDGQYSGDRR